jgi:hypothetical protein
MENDYIDEEFYDVYCPYFSVSSRLEEEYRLWLELK